MLKEEILKKIFKENPKLLNEVFPDGKEILDIDTQIEFVIRMYGIPVRVKNILKDDKVIRSYIEERLKKNSPTDYDLTRETGRPFSFVRRIRKEIEESN